MFRRNFLRFVLCLGLLVASMAPAFATQTVRVLAYPFPPFLMEDLKSGLTVDLIELFNKTQSDYRFELIVTEPEDRYAYMMESAADLVLFEKLEWSWEDKAQTVELSRTFLKDGEVYIARRDHPMGETIFDTIEDRHLALYEGYHYEFAGYNADADWLKENFTVSFAHHHQQILDLVRKRETEIGIVTLSFLKKYFKDHPERIATFMVSDDFAQRYDLKAVIRKNGPITIEQFEILLNNLKSDYHLQDLLEAYSVLRQWVY